MNPFKITERITTNRVINCFIPDPNDDHGGGWSHNATTDGEVISIEYIGNVRNKHLATLISLLETAIKEDTNRAEEYGSITFDYTTYGTDDEDFEKDAEEFKEPVVGMNANDFWICNGFTVDDKQRSITTITLIRVSNRYIALEFGNPMMSFDFQELEAVTAILYQFLAK